MLLATLAFAAYATPLLEDRAFLSAHDAWAACTNQVADRETASARSAEEIAAAALAACAAEQEATRRAVVANEGEQRAVASMRILLDANRDGLADRVRETRRRPATQPAAPAVTPAFDAAVRALFQCQKDHLDAALPGGGRDQDLIDAALRACPEQEAAARAAALQMLGGSENAADALLAEGRSIAREGMGRYVSNRRHH